MKNKIWTFMKVQKKMTNHQMKVKNQNKMGMMRRTQTFQMKKTIQSDKLSINNKNYKSNRKKIKKTLS